MAGRKYNQGTYRYGFNGKEEDSEWGSQMIQDYGFRIYNPTIGKFLSVDPLTQSYPMLTPYQFASNTPIQAIDLDGLEAVVPNPYERGGVILKYSDEEQIYLMPIKNQQVALYCLEAGEWIKYGQTTNKLGTPYLIGLDGSQPDYQFGGTYDVPAWAHGLLDQLLLFVSYFEAIEDVVEWLPAGAGVNVVSKAASKAPVFGKKLASKVASVKSKLGSNVNHYDNLTNTDLAVLSEFKKALGVSNKKNLAMAKFTKEGEKAQHYVSVSGSTKRGNGLTELKDGQTRLFITDSPHDTEAKIFETIAEQLGGKAGTVNTEIKGTIEIVSELKSCKDCATLMDQFSKMFPNINIHFSSSKHSTMKGLKAAKNLKP